MPSTPSKKLTGMPAAMRAPKVAAAKAAKDAVREAEKSQALADMVAASKKNKFDPPDVDQMDVDEVDPPSSAECSSKQKNNNNNDSELVFVNYYEVLGVAPNPGLRVMQQAYEKKLLLSHPANADGGDAELFALVTEAHDCLLKSTSAREAYDRRWAAELSAWRLSYLENLPGVVWKRGKDREAICDDKQGVNGHSTRMSNCLELEDGEDQDPAEKNAKRPRISPSFVEEASGDVVDGLGLLDGDDFDGLEDNDMLLEQGEEPMEQLPVDAMDEEEEQEDDSDVIQLRNLFDVYLSRKPAEQALYLQKATLRVRVLFEAHKRAPLADHAGFIANLRDVRTERMKAQLKLSSQKALLGRKQEVLRTYEAGCKAFDKVEPGKLLVPVAKQTTLEYKDEELRALKSFTALKRCGNDQQGGVLCQSVIHALAGGNVESSSSSSSSSSSGTALRSKNSEHLAAGKNIGQLLKGKTIISSSGAHKEHFGGRKKSPQKSLQKVSQKATAGGGASSSTSSSSFLFTRQGYEQVPAMMVAPTFALAKKMEDDGYLQTASTLKNGVTGASIEPLEDEMASRLEALKNGRIGLNNLKKNYYKTSASTSGKNKRTVTFALEDGQGQEEAISWNTDSMAGPSLGLLDGEAGATENLHTALVRPQQGGKRAEVGQEEEGALVLEEVGKSSSKKAGDNMILVPVAEGKLRACSKYTGQLLTRYRSVSSLQCGPRLRVSATGFEQATKSPQECYEKNTAFRKIMVKMKEAVKSLINDPKRKTDVIPKEEVEAVWSDVRMALEALGLLLPVPEPTTTSLTIKNTTATASTTGKKMNKKEAASSLSTSSSSSSKKATAASTSSSSSKKGTSSTKKTTTTDKTSSSTESAEIKICFTVSMSPQGASALCHHRADWREEFVWSTENFVQAFWWSRIEAEDMLDILSMHDEEFVPNLIPADRIRRRTLRESREKEAVSAAIYNEALNRNRVKAGLRPFLYNAYERCLQGQDKQNPFFENDGPAFALDRSKLQLEVAARLGLNEDDELDFDQPHATAQHEECDDDEIVEQKVVNTTSTAETRGGKKAQTTDEKKSKNRAKVDKKKGPVSLERKNGAPEREPPQDHGDAHEGLVARAATGVGGFRHEKRWIPIDSSTYASRLVFDEKTGKFAEVLPDAEDPFCLKKMGLGGAGVVAAREELKDLAKELVVLKSSTAATGTASSSMKNRATTRTFHGGTATSSTAMKKATAASSNSSASSKAKGQAMAKTKKTGGKKKKTTGKGKKVLGWSSDED